MQRLAREAEPTFVFLAALQKVSSEELNPSIRSELHALHSKVHSFGEEHPGLLITFAKLGSLYR